MIGYVDTTHAQMEVARLFHKTFPNLPPIFHGTISQIKKQFSELGHVRQIKESAANAISEDTKMGILLEFGRNSHTSSRQSAPMIDTSLR